MTRGSRLLLHHPLEDAGRTSLPTMEKCIPLTAFHVMAFSGERNSAGSTRRT